MSTKISVTRALASISKIEDKINKRIYNLECIKIAKGTENNCKIPGYIGSVDDFKKSAINDYQSLQDLLAVRDELKAKIVKSNAETIVKIGKVSMTVAEAIERKRTICFKQELLNKLCAQRASAQLLLAKEEKSLEDKLENARAPYIQRDKAPDAEQIKTVEAPIRMMNTPSVVDPLELASKIRSLEEEIEDLHHVKGIILSGGPDVIDQSQQKEVFDERLLELNIPILGICYGMEALANHFGAKIESIRDREYDKHVIRVNKNCPLFLDVPEEIVAYMTKNDRVNGGLEGFTQIAESGSSGMVGFAKDYVFGLLFHPEVAATDYGDVMIRNFVNLCDCEGNWDLDAFIDNKIKGIKKVVGDERVILGLSGGVDSAVAALLFHRAIGDNLTCVFVETGLHRYNEYNVILGRFEKNFDIKVNV